MTKISYFILLVFLGVACHSRQEYKDAAIDPAVVDSFAGLNKSIITAVTDGDTSRLVSLCTDKLLAKKKRKIFSYIKNYGVVIRSSEVALKNQYYVQHADTSASVSVTSGAARHDYTVKIKPGSSNIFFSVLTATGPANTILISMIYGDYDGQWKLEALDIGYVQTLGKDAIDWFDMSQEFYRKGSMVDAVCRLKLCSDVLKPGGEHWTYNLENEITAFRPALEREIDKMGRLEIKYVKSKPRVFNIFPTLYEGAYCPTINYKTTTTDSVALTAECTAIQEKITTMFSGLDENNKNIIYRAYTTPAGASKPLLYEFIRPTGK